jgi:molecular chaperone GrpE
VAQLSAKNSELADQYIRAQAEMQNVRRRSEEEIAKARKFAVESFAESLLPVKDSLEAAIAIPAATPEQLLEGVHATLRQLTSVLERNKVTEINPAQGARFDPHQHQAISVVAAAQEPNTVVTLLQKGYAIAASRLSFTGNRLSAKLSTAYLRVLAISSSARRRVFSASALARRKASDISVWRASSSLSRRWGSSWIDEDSSLAGPLPPGSRPFCSAFDMVL